MNINKIDKVLRVLAANNLDAVDAAILARVAETAQRRGEGTVMKVVADCLWIASRQTALNHINKLLCMEILTKNADIAENQRFKSLGLGAAYLQLLNELRAT